MVFIYILQLEQGKYYVGKTTNPKMRLENHFDSAGSSWTKKYKPINIYAIIPDCDNYDEDKYTKIYMEKFGIDNVRGGSYCQIELNIEVKKLIEQGINSSNDNCYHCSQPGHFANSCPYKQISVSEVKQELQNKKIYNCNYCKKECPDKEYLIKHLSIYCKEKPGLFSDNSTSSDDSYEIVNENQEYMNCEYCNKRMNKKYIQKHLKDYCDQLPVYDNKNSILSNLITIGERIVKNITDPKCNRCGRDGHLKNNCFASSFENGKPINKKFYKSKFKK
jgi:hypothetical protein